MSNETPLVEIAVPVNGISNVLTYQVPSFLQSESLFGKRVCIRVGSRRLVGVVIKDQGVKNETSFTLKSVEEIFESAFKVTKQQIELCQFVASYYSAPIGVVMRLCLPADTPLKLEIDLFSKKKRKRKTKESKRESFGAKKEFKLTSEQRSAVDNILDSKKSAFLLQGVTGSGKTQVYICVAKKLLEKGKSVLVVVPEIALTNQLVQRFQDELQESVLVLHSSISKKKRSEAFLKLQKKESRVVVGARSALFAPFPDLGLIVVDEEHDGSFKQEETPRYHARDVALWRAQNEDAKIILGSATPSLESFYNVEKNKLAHLKLTARIGDKTKMPEVELVDLKMRQEHEGYKAGDKPLTEGQKLCILSAPLRREIKRALDDKKQVMLFLNRRGYAAFGLCESCGEILKCPNCSVSFTYHQNSNMLRCHQCNETCALKSSCPSCKTGEVVYLGLGTERVEKEVKTYFPDKKVERLDRDVARSHLRMNNILKQMDAGEIDILIGTQMIAKGHDFKGVSLVGVILADTALAMPDFRSQEKTFQLLTQVAGRAGRGDESGKVIVQTFNPEHPAIRFAKDHDVEGFTKMEMAFRKDAMQPPFLRALTIRLEAVSSACAESCAALLKKQIDYLIGKYLWKDEVFVLGPSPAPLERLRGRFRWHMFLRFNKVSTRLNFIKTLKNDTELNKKVQRLKARVLYDVDPYNLL